MIAERRFGPLSFYVGTLGLLGGLAFIFGGFLYPFGKTRLGMVFGVVLGVLLYAGYWTLLWYYYHP